MEAGLRETIKKLIYSLDTKDMTLEQLDLIDELLDEIEEDEEDYGKNI